MKIRIGYEITYDCPKPTPMLLVLSIHPSRQADLLAPHRIVFDPPIASTDYHDAFDASRRERRVGVHFPACRPRGHASTDL